ncbi:unnamed protein product [Rotaria sordida]|uniref:MULE transposase domain-containing protein n=1 Tax=Rotaria sordida TaxID=392033 RepID=A0A814Y1G2_9BILA|nr:unnamed protein product [Rotaria sordida]CAF1503639.1 unnamed protein product [Rotaria sordida]
MPIHLSLEDRWRIISLRLDQAMSSTRIAAIANCSIRTDHNILQLFRETNDVIEREGRARARASLNNDDTQILRRLFYRGQQIQRSRDRPYQGLMNNFNWYNDKNFIIQNGTDQCSPNTLSLIFYNTCHEDTQHQTTSTTLQAIDFSYGLTHNTIRLSTSYMTIDREVNQTIILIPSVIKSQLSSSIDEHQYSDQVTLYKTEAGHDHHNEKVRGIDANVKNLGELEQWCEGNVEVPIDENKAFVVAYKILYDNEEYEDDEDIEEDGNKFRTFISSVRLLNIASMSSHLHADATYKLVWQGFPVLIVGTTDFNKAFHPFGLAVCSNEKTKDFEFIFNTIQVGMQKINKDLLKPTALISDAADAIKNGIHSNELSGFM